MAAPASNIKLVNHRYGNYYRRTTTLRVAGRKYKVSQRTKEPAAPPAPVWDSNKRAILGLLKRYPGPDWWLWQRIAEFNGMTDCVENVDMQPKPLSLEAQEHLVWQLNNIPHRITYNAETNVIECYSLAIGGFNLKFKGPIGLI